MNKTEEYTNHGLTRMDTDNEKLPEGWEWKKLGEVCEIINGGTPKSSIKEFWNGDVNWVTPKDLGQLKNRYIEETPRKITEEGLKKSSAKLFPPRSVILSTRAPIGYLAININNMSTNQGCRGIVPINSLFTEFLYYFLYNSVDQLNDLGNGATFKELSSNSLTNFLIPLPPFSEQKRIVSILDEAFAAIDKARANAEKNLANAKELFESYLNGIFANPGEDWEEKKLGEVCEKIQDGAHASPKKLYSNKGENRFLYITSKNIRNNYMDLSNVSYCEKSFHDSIYPRCNPEFGDLLLTKDGANTGKITQNTINEQFSLLSSVCLIKTRRDILIPEYVKYFIQSSVGFRQITGKMTGAAIKRIILKTIKDATINMPFIAKQEQIVSKLDKLSAETKKLESIYQQKITALDELKKSILKKAFEGEL